MRIVLGRDDGQVAHEQVISTSLAFEELPIIRDVIDTGEYFLEISKTELFFFEIEKNL